jgi:hypothetical protein
MHSRGRKRPFRGLEKKIQVDRSTDNSGGLGGGLIIGGLLALAGVGLLLLGLWWLSNNQRR